MTTPLPPAGWYPDPTGKSSQMYWDGRGWHTPSPAIPAMTRPAYAHSPGRSSSGGKVMLVIAGLLVIAGVALRAAARPRVKPPTRTRFGR